MANKDDVIEIHPIVVAIELLAACQGIEFLRPLKTTEPLEALHKLVRSHVKPWDRDRYFAPDIEFAHQLIKDGKVWEVTEPYMKKYYNEQLKETRSSSQTTSTLSPKKKRKRTK